jgi:hypothetical protein
VENQKQKNPQKAQTRLNGIAWTDNQLNAAMVENFTLQMIKTR